MPDLQNLTAPEGQGAALPAGPMGQPGAAPSDATQAPMGAPMSDAQPAGGSREDALINVHMALDLLEGAVAKLGAETPEGQIVMKSLGSLTKVFGGQRQNTEQLGNTEILGLLNKLPNAGGGSPELNTAMRQPAVPGMQGQGAAAQPQQPMQGAM
jgi:hypothetical protein